MVLTMNCSISFIVPAMKTIPSGMPPTAWFLLATGRIYRGSPGERSWRRRQGSPAMRGTPHDNVENLPPTALMTRAMPPKRMPPTMATNTAALNPLSEKISAILEKAPTICSKPP